MSMKPTGLAAFARPKLAASLDASGQDGREPSAPGRRRSRGTGETVALTVKVRRSDWQRLRQLADAEGTTIQAMAETGLSSVLEQHGLPPIEPYIR